MAPESKLKKTVILFLFFLGLLCLALIIQPVDHFSQRLTLNESVALTVPEVTPVEIAQRMEESYTDPFWNETKLSKVEPQVWISLAVCFSGNTQYHDKGNHCEKHALNGYECCLPCREVSLPRRGTDER